MFVGTVSHTNARHKASLQKIMLFEKSRIMIKIQFLENDYKIRSSIDYRHNWKWFV